MLQESSTKNNKLPKININIDSNTSFKEYSTICLDLAPFLSIMSFLSAILCLFINKSIDIKESILFSCILAITAFIMKYIKSKIRQPQIKTNANLRSKDKLKSNIDIIYKYNIKNNKNMNINNQMNQNTPTNIKTENNSSTNESRSFIKENTISQKNNEYKKYHEKDGTPELIKDNINQKYDKLNGQVGQNPKYEKINNNPKLVKSKINKKCNKIDGKIGQKQKYQRTMNQDSNLSSSFIFSNPIIGFSSEPFEIEFNNTEKGRFHGIIHHLGNICGGNVHKKGVVEITSSSIAISTSFSCTNLLFRHVKNHMPYNCADLENINSCFESKVEPNSWICYDFQNLKVKPNYYSIRTYVNGINHLLSWRIEGSDDKTNWIILDQRINDHSLDGIGFANTFQIYFENDNYYRYLRLKQIGKGTDGIDMLNISALDFFGFIYCPNSIDY